MSAVSTELSDSLNAFHEDFLKAGQSGHPLPASQMLVLARSFALLYRLAKTLETELAIHRLNASVDRYRAILEGASTDMLGQLILESDGKVVRPDFKSGRNLPRGQQSTPDEDPS